MDIFLKEKEKKVVFDYPIILENNKMTKQKKRNKFFKTYWDYIHPTSCIAIRKSISDNIFDTIGENLFENTWMDFRIHLYTKYLDNNFLILDENLTYYRQHIDSATSRFTKISKNWWKRRSEAHDYFFNFAKKNNLEAKRNYDFMLTKLISKLIL